MTTINDSGNLTGHLVQESIFLTFICWRPLVSARVYCAVLTAAVGLLTELDRSRHGAATLEWSVVSVLIGHSEGFDKARIAVELVGQPVAANSDDASLDTDLYEDLSTALHQLRTAAGLPSTLPTTALPLVLELADSLNGDVAELWFSQSGVTPVFITLDTWHNVRQCLGQEAAPPEGTRVPPEVG